MMRKSAMHVDENMYSKSLSNSFTDVYDRHVDTVYRVCFSMTSNKHDAEDAVQSVFIKYMESNRAYIDNEHEKAWLIVTARNTCIDLHRKWWRKKVVEYDLDIVSDREKDPFQYQDLEKKLKKLPPTHRLILYLHYYEGYKVNEIADMLKMNENTVKTRMRNARKRLKIEIEEEYYGRKQID